MEGQLFYFILFSPYYFQMYGCDPFMLAHNFTSVIVFLKDTLGIVILEHISENPLPLSRAFEG